MDNQCNRQKKGENLVPATSSGSIMIDGGGDDDDDIYKEAIIKLTLRRVPCSAI